MNDMEIKKNKLLTVKEVADFLRITRKSVYILIKQNALPVIRLGYRTIRFDPADVQKWLNETKQTPKRRETVSHGKQITGEQVKEIVREVKRQFLTGKRSL